jgi:hypothetical protein
MTSAAGVHDTIGVSSRCLVLFFEHVFDASFASPGGTIVNGLRVLKER